jgi:hypothetical protein
MLADVALHQNWGLVVSARREEARGVEVASSAKWMSVSVSKFLRQRSYRNSASAADHHGSM